MERGEVLSGGKDEGIAEGEKTSKDRETEENSLWEKRLSRWKKEKKADTFGGGIARRYKGGWLSSCRGRVI